MFRLWSYLFIVNSMSTSSKYTQVIENIHEGLMTSELSDKARVYGNALKIGLLRVCFARFTKLTKILWLRITHLKTSWHCCFGYCLRGVVFFSMGFKVKSIENRTNLQPAVGLPPLMPTAQHLALLGKNDFEQLSLSACSVLKGDNNF